MIITCVITDIHFVYISYIDIDKINRTRVSTVSCYAAARPPRAVQGAAATKHPQQKAAGAALVSAVRRGAGAAALRLGVGLRVRVEAGGVDAGDVLLALLVGAVADAAGGGAIV